MKSNTIILSLIGGAALLAGLHHGDVYRDEYRTREDCRQDWSNDPAQCENAGNGAYGGGGTGGGGRYWGPSYERDARPFTRHPELRQGVSLVKRGGFGRSGARFGGGG